MLDDLVAVIETLQQRIRDHGPTLRENETRTRLALIDPLLSALGWDVSDPALVTPEYSVGAGRADYALIGSEAIPAAMVEAKRLRHNLSDDERMQMLNYANARGVRYAAITDGDVWEFYEVFRQAPLEDRRLLNLRIASRPAHESALQLLLLWRPNVASGQPVTAAEPILDAETASDPETTPVDNSPANLLGWVALSKYDLPGGSPNPAAVKFPDGTETLITQWHEILTRTTEWLYAQGALNVNNVPLTSNSPHRYVVNTEPVHPNGNSFGNPVNIHGSPLWVNINLNSAQIRTYTRILLEHCGIDPATVQLQVGQ